MEKHIAIIGAGPSGLFMYKKLIESGRTDFTIDIFEAKNYSGAGMPYSNDGASTEHITNVSGNEIPKLVIPIVDWIKTLHPDALKKYNLNPETVHEFMVLPRLLFGEYLEAQFNMLQANAAQAGISTQIHFNCRVNDIADEPLINKIKIKVANAGWLTFNTVIICSGHNWPVTYEGNVDGYYDSPYPPAKLKKRFNHSIAIRGSSLTAIDAVRTLARANGTFVQEQPHKFSYHTNNGSPDFKIFMHSRHGLLPAIRFHLDDSHLSNKSLLTKEDINNHRKNNDGFLSLDFIFEKDFKEPFKEKDLAFYQQIKDKTIEEFVDFIMTFRESIDPFLLFKGEYAEAQKSIDRKKSIYWKEMLGVLSFAMNYPAKHFSAEDMQRLQRVLMPLISVVIAYVPQSSCEELIALHDAGKLELIDVGYDNEIVVNNNGEIIIHYKDVDGNKQEKKYQTFIDCIGQKHLSIEDFPFKSLVTKGSVTPARLRFRDINKINKNDNYEKDNNVFYLKVPGIAINDNFSAVDKNGNENPRLYIMAVPYIGGFNPDYSGLDFCEAASKIIAENIFINEKELVK